MIKIYREKDAKNALLLPMTKFMFWTASVLLTAAVYATAFMKPASKLFPERTAAETEAEPKERITARENEVMDKNGNLLFLINKENPLPAGYGESVELSAVYRSGEKEYYMDRRAALPMRKMLSAAEKDGIKLIVVSAYRSEEYQRENFEKSVSERITARGMSYDEAYADASREVAMPRESEHNSGLAADILSEEYMSLDDDGFRNTKAFSWLCEHAAEYGFILRYPENKEAVTGFVFEPWHYRYVGKEHAGKIAGSGLCLEEYLSLVRN